jgi:hypothetical protein
MCLSGSMLVRRRSDADLAVWFAIAARKRD